MPFWPRIYEITEAFFPFYKVSGFEALNFDP
jgi:hypothetical protein